MRLIDADALEVVCFKDNGGCFADGVQWVLEKIDALPTVQPQTGHWIVTDEAGHAKCSECRASMDLGGGDYRNYCPNCGARMVTE